MTDTQVFIETFKGNPVFAIWKVDANGTKIGRYPVVSFGVKKAKAILEHFNEIEGWVQEQESRAAAAVEIPAAGAQSAKIDLTLLSADQQAAFKALLAQASK